MYTLICDSATKVLYMTLVVDDKVIEERYYEDGKKHSIHIVKGLEEMLVKYHLKAKDIDKFICGIGPGSYTGVRMAVTVAKMFGDFTKTKVYTISTLALMASKQKGKVLSYIDARNNNAFGAIYLDLEPILPDSFIDIDTLKSKEYDTIVTDDNFKVDALKVISKAKLVEEVDLLIPNYLRATEAERSLHD